MADKKIIKRLSPCSAYDIAGTEQWLEEMAAKGYHLIPERGFFLGIGRFEKGEPKQVRYRLQAASAKMALFEVIHMNTDVRPDEEALQIYEEMGWEYVTNRLAFHVFRSARTDAREFHTDPAVQAECLKSAGVRLILLLIAVILVNLSSLVNAFLYSFSFGMGPYGGLVSFLCILLNVWIDLEVINRFVRFLILRRRVKRGENLRTDKRRRSTLFYRLIVLAVLWLAHLVLLLANGMQAEEIPVSDYTEPIPFVTLAESYPEGVEVEEETPRWFSNSAEIGSTLLAGENLYWTESMLLQMPDGTEISANFSGEYHYARSEAVAKWMVNKQIKENKALPYGCWEIDTPDAEVDCTLLYGFEVGGPQLILREGRHVVIAEIGYAGIMDDPTYLDTERWVTEMTDALIAYAGES